MVADHLIAARVSADMKAQLRSLAGKRNISESALLKDLLELTLVGSGSSQLGEAGPVAKTARRSRLYVRLRPDDQLLLAERAAADLIQDWDLDLAECQSGLGQSQSRPAPKLVHKLVFSMPAGTPPDKVLLATQEFCREQWALKHRFVMALHTDEPHPHVHVIVKAVSEQSERLNIRKATLREWREEFARHLRRVGVEANATPRVVRAETRPRKSDGIYRTARRGVSTHIHDLVEATVIRPREPDRTEDLARQRVRETRRALECGWHAAGDVLENQGRAALAKQTRSFVRDLPPARTEREWLMAGLQQRQGRPTLKLERSR